MRAGFSRAGGLVFAFRQANPPFAFGSCPPCQGGGKRKPRMNLRLLSAIGLLGFFAAWWLIAASGLVQPQFLPTPLAVVLQFCELLQKPFAGYTLEQHLLS